MNLFDRMGKIAIFLKENIFSLPETENLGNCIVAGGSIVRMLEGQEYDPETDIDLFVNPRSIRGSNYFNTQDDKFYKDLFKKYEVIKESKRAIMFQLENCKVHIIRYPLYSTPQELFESFDYTICCAGVDNFGNYIFHPRFFHDLNNKLLRCNGHFSRGEGLSSVERLYKYMKRGYRPVSPAKIFVNLKKIASLHDLY